MENLEHFGRKLAALIKWRYSNIDNWFNTLIQSTDSFKISKVKIEKLIKEEDAPSPKEIQYILKYFGVPREFFAEKSFSVYIPKEEKTINYVWYRDDSDFRRDINQEEYVPIIKEYFGGRLRKALDYTGTPVMKLCKEARFSSAGIYKMIRSDITPTPDTIDRICKYLNIPFDFFISDAFSIGPYRYTWDKAYNDKINGHYHQKNKNSNSDDIPIFRWNVCFDPNNHNLAEFYSLNPERDLEKKNQQLKKAVLDHFETHYDQLDEASKANILKKISPVSQEIEKQAADIQRKKMKEMLSLTPSLEDEGYLKSLEDSYIEYPSEDNGYNFI